MSSQPLCADIEIAAFHWVIKEFTTACAFRVLIGVRSWDFPLWCLCASPWFLCHRPLSHRQGTKLNDWEHRKHLWAVLGLGEKPAAAGWWHIGRLLKFLVGDADRRSSTWFWMGKADARILGSCSFNRTIVLVLCGVIASFGNSIWAKVGQGLEWPGLTEGVPVYQGVELGEL